MGRHLVTGATGLIGSEIARQLLDAGHDVVALVRPATDAAPLETLGVAVARGDLTDAASVAAAVAGCEGVFHAAAMGGRADQSDELGEAVNAAGTAAVLDAARAAGVRRVVAVSSPAAFVEDETLTERSPVHPAPADPYGRSKAKAFLETMRRVDAGQDVVVVLPGATYGPSPLDARILQLSGGNQRTARALAGEPATYLPMLVPNSSTTDVAAVCLAAYERGTAGERYLALGAPDSVCTVAGTVNRALELAGVSHRVDEVPHERLDDPELLATWGPTLLHRARVVPPEPFFDASATVAALGHRFGPLDQRLTEMVTWLREDCGV